MITFSEAVYKFFQIFRWLQIFLQWLGRSELPKKAKSIANAEVFHIIFVFIHQQW